VRAFGSAGLLDKVRTGSTTSIEFQSRTRLTSNALFCVLIAISTLHLSRSSQIQQTKALNNNMPSFTIQNSVAFVTGTNKPNGIGRAIVEALLSHGAAKVYATARDAVQLEDLVAQHDDKVVAVALDVTDLKAIANLSIAYPDVTLVVNNAGYAAMTSSIQDVERTLTEIQVNYIAPMAIGKSFAPVFANLKGTEEESRPSAFVNINSIASFVNFPIAGTYSASKAAAHSLTQAQRRDLNNSLVIGVYPGPIDTAMAEDVPFDKVPPSVVADALIEALQQGTEDVFPDPMAQQLYEGFKADAKAVEKYMTAQPETPETIQPEQ
jgi:NAD(P)-dependent dehydrogenase (short-subunit alcohol dehydrogenase family)